MRITLRFYIVFLERHIPRCYTFGYDTSGLALRVARYPTETVQLRLGHCVCIVSLLTSWFTVTLAVASTSSTADCLFVIRRKYCN